MSYDEAKLLTFETLLPGIDDLYHLISEARTVKPTGLTDAPGGYLMVYFRDALHTDGWECVMPLAALWRGLNNRAILRRMRVPLVYNDV